MVHVFAANQSSFRQFQPLITNGIYNAYEIEEIKDAGDKTEHGQCRRMGLHGLLKRR
jgi:hypothetical protein